MSRKIYLSGRNSGTAAGGDTLLSQVGPSYVIVFTSDKQKNDLFFA